MGLSVKISTTFSATQVIVDDVTGDYNASTNPGGYGSPNAAFTDFAHYCIIRKKNVNGVADEVLVLDSYDPLSSTEFTVTRSVDGWYEAKKLNISKWSAGSYGSGVVVYNSGSVYLSNTATSGTPGASADWDVVTDLTTIEDNASVIVTIDGRVTAYNADTYWSKQIALNSQKGYCGIPMDDKQKLRLDKIKFHIDAALVADQLGDNENGEWNVLALIQYGAQ